MSALQEQVQESLKDAMRRQDAIRRSALRMLIAALKNAEIEARKPLDEAAAIAVLQKQAKQRRESIAEFEKANRQDLVAQEQGELAVLEEFLPEQATDEDLLAAAREVIASTGAAGPRDMGKVMPVLTARFAGRADGRRISEIVRGLLGP
jgi:uncharacterized protein YqeY